ncbi:MAG: hypothetical protein A2Y84_01875 [Candidatus Colwellbacteria bacterium RBG_13_48_8]|uniref:Peptidase S11 D-alanyl-D-alanine carboxypeptidase A N-terminal domain-containing protein n=1 Tax=Candidatus Colwellbacteria bacterium RBG_13_48_8 TaxID=1797685 RepID=A0A1G1YVJ5_9BACT|nr:MAG: hypothetical protein A2Y84_01875 [Candidatus Colwellbacteria bacterium RBG_13_48_8]
MTALVATEYINIEREINITQEMLVATSHPRLYAGQRVSVLDLLYPLLMESSNEAGEAIASILGKERFVGLMNEKAQAIGMSNSHFTDTTGADPGNISTAQDLFQLAKYLYNNRGFILGISRGETQLSVYGLSPWRDLKNFNVFDQDPGFIGGKVGMTNAAGETIISIFEVVSASTTRPVAVVALESANRAGDASALIDYVRNSY